MEDVTGSVLTKDPVVEIKRVEAASKPFEKSLLVFLLNQDLTGIEALKQFLDVIRIPYTA